MIFGCQRYVGFLVALLAVVPQTVRGEETRPARQWRLSNGQLELQFQLQSNRVVLRQMVNKLSGRTIPIVRDDFSLGIEGREPLTAADFTFQEASEEAVAGGRRLTFRYKNDEPGARLDVVYELGDAAAFVRRRLELTPNKPLPLRTVDMWRVGLEGKCAAQEQCMPICIQLAGPDWGHNANHQGFGFPVFLEDTFWGLEYPAGYNHYEAGTMTLRHFPGRTIAQKYTSKTAVLGVAEPGKTAERFRQYLNSIIGVRSSPPLFFAWKTWVTTSPDEKNCLTVLDAFRKNLFDARGARLDSFALDDGWDKKASLWEIEPRCFPNGFKPLQVAMKPMNTGLGLWISPCSGYSHAPWLAANRGYKSNKNTWLLCMSDPNYRRDMVKTVVELVKKHNVNYVKFDGFCAPCDAPHVHHLPGNYAKEANTDAYQELQAALRKAQPNIFINITTGTWVSPWWLQYADSVWDEVFDGWSPGIAPSPELSYSQITDRDAVFRKRCRENPWFPFEALENLGVWTQNYNFVDEQIMTVFARGCRLISFYLQIPRGVNADRDWRFIGTAINWARHNEKTLLHTQMILGDPMRFEPYGYAHFRNDRGILVLRNPSIESKTVKVKLDESSGGKRADAEKNGKKPLVAKIVYPRHETLPDLLHYGEELTIEIGAYEMPVIHVAPLDETGVALLGARCEETERAGTRITYTVHAPSGEKPVVTVAGRSRPAEARWNGQVVVPSTTSRGIELPLPMTGTPQACRVEGGTLVRKATDKGWTISGKCVATVPEGTRAAMHLVWAYPEALNPPAPKRSDTEPVYEMLVSPVEKAKLRQQAENLRAVKPQCAITVNGKPINPAIRDSKLYRPENVGDHITYAEYPPAPWVWFQFNLPPGRSEVAVSIEWPNGAAAPELPVAGWWLWAERPLQKGTLTLSYGEPLPPAPTDPLPATVRQEWQRRILTIHPASIFADKE